MADPKLKFVVVHGSIKLGPPGIDADGKEHDGYARVLSVVELTAAQRLSMDPKGELLVTVAEFEAAKKIAAANAALDHERNKARAKDKKAMPLPRKLEKLLSDMSDKVRADLEKADAAEVEKKPAHPK